MSDDERANGIYRWALVLVPALLMLSAAGAVWFHWRSETNDDPHPGLALGVTALGDEELRDSVGKLTEYIGPREWETPEGRRHLRQVIAYVSGTLSPRNYGYVVRSDGGVSLAGERWPTLWVDARGSESGVVMVAVPYDGDDVSVAVALALAGELREAGLKRTLRFVFYPAELWERVGPPKLGFLETADLVLCVNRLGAGRDLWSVGPALGPEELYFREAVDGHDDGSGGRREARHFSHSGGRVYDIRGTETPVTPEERGAAGGGGRLDTDGRKLVDLRARVGRLGAILRGAANSE